MPQDSLRSVVYRSFVTCDDPKGVAECKTIRRSKSDSKKMENKIKNQRIQQNSSTSMSYEEGRKDKVSKGSTEELQNLSSFQITEVSRGAQKLNEVIDSWSNRTSFDKQSKHIAKDLLKGALDLQESLVMLGKLQEASQYIAKSKKRHKEKPVGGRVDVGTEFMDSNPLGDNNQAMDFQKPRISADRSSRDCYDELREVIRESFARQNLLPKVSAKEKDYVDRKNLDFCMDFPSSSSSQSKEKDYVDRKNLDFCMDFPSSSSSQSSLIHPHSCNCSPSKVQLQKPKGPNLIAKLMGLEGVPPKAVNSMIYKQMEKEKLPNQRSLLLDIDLPRPRKPQFMVQKVVRERRKLEEMIETMQFKGLLERKSIDGSSDGKYHSDVSFLRKSLAVEGPPIVIMRPRHVPDLRAKELHENYWINEEKPIKIPRGQLKFTETNEKLRAGRTPNQKLNKDKEGKHSGESPARLVKKTLDIEDGPSTMKINHSKPLAPRVQKKEATVKKIDDVPKVASNARKLAEIKDSKSQESAQTQDLGKITTVKLSKTARDSNVSKCQVARGKAAAPDKHMKPTSLKSSIPKKNLQKGKPDSKPLAALVENIQSDDRLPINIESNIHGSLMKGTTSEQIAEEAMSASYISISDNSGNAPSSPCESSGPIIKDDVKYIEDGSCISCCNLDEMKGCKSISNTRYLLLSSVSFLNLAEELFKTGTCDATVLQTAWLPDGEMLDDSLLLECAKEILERKILSCTRTINPLSHNLFKKPKCHLSLEQLIGEISNGIEDLRNYTKSCGDIILVDSIYSMLERDLWWNEEVTGAWDSGWRNGYATEEVNEVVHDVEKLVLSEIVADVVIEFMF
ncbi:hypothetical protein Pfo_000444 [Paulownia fortunei]|nr:hypothetical protein Pfo_000444 [Paulownia fortunei]